MRISHITGYSHISRSHVTHSCHTLMSHIRESLEYIIHNRPFQTESCTHTHINTNTNTHTRTCDQLQSLVNRKYVAWYIYHPWLPRTEEIGLKLITTAKISNKFSRESPYISNKFLRDSPKIWTKFHLSKWSPCHSNDLSGKLIDLKIQIKTDLLRERIGVATVSRLDKIIGLFCRISSLL